MQMGILGLSRSRQRIGSLNLIFKRFQAMPQNGYPSTEKTELWVHFKGWLLASFPFLLGNHQKLICSRYKANGDSSGSGYQNMSRLEHGSLNPMDKGNE